MARLKTFQNGQFVAQLELSPAREHLVGRGETCNIVLAPERGISRQHFKVRFEDGQWLVEVLSRFGELYLNGEKQAGLTLKHGLSFTVPPYEFVFEDESEGALESVSVSRENTEDKTHIGYMDAVAYLKLSDQRGSSMQNFKLEGQAWFCGRDTSCSIYIDNNRFGRRQFEIQKQDEVYFIRDLGSVNATLVNGRQAPGDDWTALSSGDVIAVADLSLQFELRDSQYEQRLAELNPIFSSPAPFSEQSLFANQEQDLGSTPAQGFSFQGGRTGFRSSEEVNRKPGMHLFGRFIPGLNPVRLALGVVILLAALFGFFGQDSGDGKAIEQTKIMSPFEKLTPEKQQTVKQLYLMAQSLLAQGRYEMARQEIIKLHQLIPYYEDSKQIEETASQGLSMLAERESADAEERQRVAVEEKIQKQVAQCKAQINSKSETNWLEHCLSPIMEFNPEHPAIQALRLEVSRLSEERVMKQAQQKEYAGRVARLLVLFESAQKIEKLGRPLPAIDAYEKVVQSKLPDPKGVQKVAKRQIASLQEGVVTKQAEAEQKAEVAYRAGQLKQAILLLREGMRINPANEVLKGHHTQYMAELRKQMMNFYQEGILEESVGEVETAKAKWKKIIEQSLPGEDYFEKAKLKLKKYGAF